MKGRDLLFNKTEFCQNCTVGEILHFQTPCHLPLLKTYSELILSQTNNLNAQEFS